MPKKLNTYVHAIERDDQGNTGRSEVFGPNDTVPAWAQKAITNPDVWADGSDESDEVERPAGNAGRDKWAAYAETQGVTVTDEMKRDDIIAAVDSKE